MNPLPADMYFLNILGDAVRRAQTGLQRTKGKYLVGSTGPGGFIQSGLGSSLLRGNGNHT